MIGLAWATTCRWSVPARSISAAPNRMPLMMLDDYPCGWGEWCFVVSSIIIDLPLAYWRIICQCRLVLTIWIYLVLPPFSSCFFCIFFMLNSNQSSFLRWKKKWVSFKPSEFIWQDANCLAFLGCPGMNLRLGNWDVKKGRVPRRWKKGCSPEGMPRGSGECFGYELDGSWWFVSFLLQGGLKWFIW